MLRQISLGTLGLSIGSVLTIVGFVAYAADNATLNLVGFFYGFPLLLGGLALKANELPPIPFSQPTSAAVLHLRQQQATVTQNKIRKDITRYCYGQNAHLDSALAYLGLSPSDEERPVITGLRETEINGAYTLILEFDSPSIPVSEWEQRQEKMSKYFGPGIKINITSLDDQKIELGIITNSQ